MIDRLGMMSFSNTPVAGGGTSYDFVIRVVEIDVGYPLNFARGYSWVQVTEQQSQSDVFVLDT